MHATAETITLIVGDDDLQDRYIADLVKVDHCFRDKEANPIVKIRFILRYPIQHAIIWPDVPKDNAPVGEGVNMPHEGIRTRYAAANQPIQQLCRQLDRCTERRAEASQRAEGQLDGRDYTKAHARRNATAGAAGI